MTAVSDARVRTKSIVVGIVDDRHAGALAYALQVALAESASVRIVRVAAKDEVVRTGLALPIPSVDVVGDPVEALVQESRDADLLVIEAPLDPMTALTDPLLVALRRATSALLVEVNHDGEIVRASGAEGWEYTATPDSRFAMPPAGPITERFICVGVDSSPASDAAVEWAAAMASRVSLSLTLVSVFDRADGRRTREDAAADVAAAAALVPGAEPNRVIAGGEIAEALLDAARGAEMLVLGRHSTSGMIHNGLGSVGDTCSRLSDCPVVIVPQH